MHKVQTGKFTLEERGLRMAKNANRLTRLGVPYEDSKKKGVFLLQTENQTDNLNFVGSTSNSFIKFYYDLCKSQSPFIQKIIQHDHTFKILYFATEQDTKADLEKKVREFQIEYNDPHADKLIHIDLSSLSDFKNAQYYEEQITDLVEYCESNQIDIKEFIQFAISYFESSDMFAPSVIDASEDKFDLEREEDE